MIPSCSIRPVYLFFCYQTTYEGLFFKVVKTVKDNTHKDINRSKLFQSELRYKQE